MSVPCRLLSEMTEAQKRAYVLADNKLGEWNSFRIRQVGARTTVWLNKKLIVDHATLENYFDRSRPLFHHGPIQLQTHGGEIRWRNVFIREITAREEAAKPNKVEEGFTSLFNGKDLTNWVDVNTSPETWSVKDGLLVCTGRPIGVMRSVRQYENFILVIEWRHMKAGGNSGIFLWSDAIPKGRLPLGMEVQMLELEWPYIHKRNGKPNHLGYVSGELFGAGGMRAIPENPRGNRSMSYEMRCRGKGEWKLATGKQVLIPGQVVVITVVE